MKHILSIQSHVAFGYVGNRAAVFPLQRLGFDVSVINTVQFSNHTGYGQWQGDIFSANHIQSVFEGIAERGVLPDYDGFLTGYLGSPDTGQTILSILTRLRAENTALVYCCDPVIGDVGRGVFVKPGVGEFFREQLVQHADILTPNEFELGYLTDMKLDSLQRVQEACHKLLTQGVKKVLVTSVSVPDLATDEIGILLYSEEGAYLATTPKLHFSIAPNGAGDATAALFLGHLLKEQDETRALQKTVEAIYAIFHATHKAGTRELQLIASQDYFDVEPQFGIRKL
jgi:pyridoxine kinase